VPDLSRDGGREELINQLAHRVRVGQLRFRN
jgi:hypothetical protein